MTRMPSVFFGHGTPMIAMLENHVTDAWRRIMASMSRPRAVLCISAHWQSVGIGVTSQAWPPTIHDFGGFPRAMHEFEYPAPGDPQLVARIEGLLAPYLVHPTDRWGFDHGCWTVLMKVLPAADVPVIQLSLDTRRSPAEHFEIGRLLAPLRDEGVLIMGSGNIVHNLRDVIRTDDAPPRDYAQRFGAAIRDAIAQDRPEAVLDWRALGDDGARAQPSDEHLQPLFYTLGARQPGDRARFACDFVQYSSIDMTSVILEAA
jgi:4,5-DOPA dioxygenase extradiol